MPEANNSEINVDDLMQKIRIEVKKRRRVVQQFSAEDHSVETAKVSAMIDHIELLLRNAESRTNVRTKLPDKLSRFLLKPDPIQNFVLKLFNFLFRDQREVNLNLLRALRESTAINRHLMTEIKTIAARVSHVDHRLHQEIEQQDTSEDQHSLDAFYAEFEGQFRGDRLEIKERLNYYIPTIEKASETSASKRVIDVGCGRGEWLELLAEANFSALGVDTNRVMIKSCQDQGFDVIEKDGIEHLASLPSDSVMAVSAFHVIEHLSFRDHMEFIDQAFRVLEPDGVLILETPNPENLIVGACNFYLDPTHRNPIPPMMAKFILENRGFHAVEVHRLHDTDTDHHLNNAFLQTLLLGCQDYAVIGWKK